MIGIMITAAAIRSDWGHDAEMRAGRDGKRVRFEKSILARRSLTLATERASWFHPPVRTHARGSPARRS
jgi:hypothetical protein